MVNTAHCMPLMCRLAKGRQEGGGAGMDKAPRADFIIRTDILGDVVVEGPGRVAGMPNIIKGLWHFMNQDSIGGCKEGRRQA